MTLIQNETYADPTAPEKGADLLFSQIEAVRIDARRAASALLHFDNINPAVIDKATEVYAETTTRLEDKAENPEEPYLSSIVSQIGLSQIREMVMAVGSRDHNALAGLSAEETMKSLFNSGRIAAYKQNNDPMFDAFTQMDLGINYTAIYMQSQRFDHMSEEFLVDPSFSEMVDANGLRPVIDAHVGFSTKDLDEKSEQHFLGYMAESPKSEFDIFAGTVREFGDDEARKVFAEAFLATEFGDDFGELLIDLANSEDHKKLTTGLAHLNSMRQRAYEIGEMFRSGDSINDLFADRIPIAFIKRTTELLALARQDGLTDELLETMKTLDQVGSAIARSINKPFAVVSSAEDFTSYRSDDNRLVLTARPEGDGSRLGFRVRGLGSDGKQDVSVRLDYDEWGLSLDIGSSGDRSFVNASSLGVQVGNQLAEGESALVRYRRELLGLPEPNADVELNGHHVREAFQDMSITKQQFGDVVNSFTYQSITIH